MGLSNKKYNYTYELDDMKVSIINFGNFFEESVDSITHSHANYEIHFVAQGLPTLSTINSNIRLEQQKACIISPNIVHTWNYENKKVVKCSFGFSFEKINKKHSYNTYEIFSNAICKIGEIQVLNNTSKYIDEINKIIRICSSETPFKHQKLKLCFSYIFMEIADDLFNEFNLTSNKSKQKIDTELTEKIIRRTIIEDYINTNYSKDISLDSLSKTLHLSQKQTERFFCNEMDTTFIQYVINIRLNAAIHYLKNTDLTVNEIASKIGYNSYNGFYRLFVKNIGTTPQEYRKKYKV